MKMRNYWKTAREGDLGQGKTSVFICPSSSEELNLSKGHLKYSRLRKIKKMIHYHTSTLHPQKKQIDYDRHKILVNNLQKKKTSNTVNVD